MLVSGMSKPFQMKRCRPVRRSAIKRISPVATINMVETAAMLGSTPISTDEKMRTGKVVWFQLTLD